MNESFRSETAHAENAASAADRDAKIEELLLTGLDHYFAAQYQQAINVWTRALFLDRSHARARAYIERARSAMAERQRESEELLQHGVDAFRRGDSAEARRLLKAAIEDGAPSEEAFALLERMNRLDASSAGAAPAPADRAPRGHEIPRGSTGRRSARRVVIAVLALAVVAALGGYAAVPRLASWPPAWPFDALRDAPQPAAAAPVAHETVLPLPRRGETAMGRARALAATGHLRDALAALDAVRPTDPEQPDADRLRADLQRQLLALAGRP